VNKKKQKNFFILGPGRDKANAHDFHAFAEF
jgi:hypothetical protein